jgi:hypothetical protein
MSVAEISHQIQSIGFLTYIRESGYTYPMILSIHLATIAVFGGMILMTDFRILGWAMREVPVSEVYGQLRRWKQIGFVIMVTMGLLLATSEMDKYYGNPYFLMKMSLLLLVAVHAIVFRKSVYGNTEALDRAPQMPAVAKWRRSLRWFSGSVSPAAGVGSRTTSPKTRIKGNRHSV